MDTRKTGRVTINMAAIMYFSPFAKDDFKGSLIVLINKVDGAYAQFMCNESYETLKEKISAAQH